jgi:hypothetical protein
MYRLVLEGYVVFLFSSPWRRVFDQMCVAVYFQVAANNFPHYLNQQVFFNNQFVR